MLDEVTGQALGPLEATGLRGVVALCLIETVFPPIAGAPLPLIGWVAQTSGWNIMLTVLAATLGSVAGAWAWYAIGRVVGGSHSSIMTSWTRRWTRGKDFQRSLEWFEARSSRAVLVGRWVPLVRSMVSLPAGITRMPLPRFTALTFVGCLVWNGAMIIAGAILGGSFVKVAHSLGSVAAVALLIIAGGACAVWSYLNGVGRATRPQRTREQRL